MFAEIFKYRFLTSARQVAKSNGERVLSVRCLALFS